MKVGPDWIAHVANGKVGVRFPTPKVKKDGRCWQRYEFLFFFLLRLFEVALAVLAGLSLVMFIMFVPLRIAMNMATIFDPESVAKKFLYEDSTLALQVTDGLLRPLICGVSYVPFFFRFNRKFGLHIASLLGCTVLVMFSFWVEWSAARQIDEFWLLLYVCWVGNIGLELVASLKLDALWKHMGFCCTLAWFILIVVRLVMPESPLSLGLWLAAMAILSIAKAAVLFWEAHSKQKLLLVKQMKDGEMSRNSGRAVKFLRFGACSLIVNPLYLCFVEVFGQELGMAPAYVLTNNTILALLSILLLGGLIGPDTLNEIEVLAELAYMARSQGKRVAFPGMVNESSRHCIVSFPGKYAEEWDSAVRMAEIRSGACSLACVFLTDRDSGLGVHEENPEEPGQCWCKALYGQVPAGAYITTVEDAHTISPEDLQFKERDAAAMGQIFLKREGQTDEQWAADRRLAETAAKDKCQENCGRAPWGCRWFHDWKRNVDRAALLRQILHVFYFEGRVGCGKLPWEELSNETSVKEARKNSGLGASQTAEVAYLNKQGYKFEEHDVGTFYNFMQSHST